MKNRLTMPIYIALLLLTAISCKKDPIEVPLTEIEMALSVDYIEEGLTDTLKLSIHPQNSTNTDYIWSSSDPSIAQVNPDGVVKGISPGKAIIVVSTVDNTITASYPVQVIRWTYYSKENVTVRPIAIDPQDNVWNGGIELTRITNNGEHVNTNIKNVAAIAVDTNNKWFGTYNSGIWKFDGANWTNYTNSNSDLTYNSVISNSMMLDQKGHLWFGTANWSSGTGVTMFDGSQWHAFNSDNGLVHNNVVNMAIDNQNNKWFVTTRGISMYDDSQWVSYTSENTGIELIDQVFSMAIDNENNKWFGTYGGALKFDGSNWTVYNNANSGIQWNSINAIAVDKDRNLWFATESGVSKFDGTNWTNYTCITETEYKVYNVRAIAIDSEGNKWLGTSYGVIKLED